MPIGGQPMPKSKSPCLRRFPLFSMMSVYAGITERKRARSRVLWSRFSRALNAPQVGEQTQIQRQPARADRSRRPHTAVRQVVSRVSAAGPARRWLLQGRGRARSAPRRSACANCGLALGAHGMPMCAAPSCSGFRADWTVRLMASAGHGIRASHLPPARAICISP